MVPRALAFVLLTGACARDLPARSPPVAAAAPVASVAAVPVASVAEVSAPPPLVPAVPTIHPGVCVSDDRPTHRLVVTASERTLDGARLGRDFTDISAVIKGWSDDRTLSLAIDPDISFVMLHSLLAELQAVPGLRLWISVRVGDDPQLQHIPIRTPRLGVLTYIVGLPPATYILRLDGDSQVRDEPFILPARGHVLIEELLVIPGGDSSWRAVAAALAIPCGAATLIDPPLMTPSPPRFPSVRSGPLTVTGSAVYKDTVRRILRARVNEARYCYNAALRRDPRTRGRVTIEFTIDARGKVASASVADSTVVDHELALCIAQAVRRWSFVKPEDGREVSARGSWLLEF